jgi:hypothetical protein
MQNEENGQQREMAQDQCPFAIRTAPLVKEAA